MSADSKRSRAAAAVADAAAPPQGAAPAHAGYTNVALVLQGGGALGSYQAGVVQGLAEAGIEPNWVAGISIGALNAAVIAGNPPERRVERLQAFWTHISRQPWWPTLAPLPGSAAGWPDEWRRWFGRFDAARALLEGQNGFFVPRASPPLLPHAGTPDTASYYDTAPLRDTLLEFADFKLINRPEAMRVSVGAVQVDSGNLDYFDNTEMALEPEHFMASGALPPGFPAVKVGEHFYWDGGLVSNTPLLQVLMSEPRQDTLVFQIDLWNARGEPPTCLPEVAERQKDILYSSRTRMVTDYMHDQQLQRKRLADVLALLPPELRDEPAAQRAAAFACDRRCNVIQLIYRDTPYEVDSKDYAFGRQTLAEHWASGLADIRHTLAHPECLAMPSGPQTFVTHDVNRTAG